MNPINNHSGTLEMNMEDEMGLMLWGLLMCLAGGEVSCLRVQKSKTDPFFFNISSFEFHVHQQHRVIKNDCRAAARPRLIIQQFRPIFVISCLYAFVQQHSSFDPLTSGETYSWPLSVTSLCVFRLS